VCVCVWIDGYVISDDKVEAQGGVIVCFSLVATSKQQIASPPNPVGLCPPIATDDIYVTQLYLALLIESHIIITIGGVGVALCIVGLFRVSG
jgi:hypothetical protein